MQVVNDILHGNNLLGIVVGDIELALGSTKLFLNGHYHFHEVEGISVEVIYEGGGRDHLIIINPELFNHDLLEPLEYGRHPYLGLLFRFAGSLRGHRSKNTIDELGRDATSEGLVKINSLVDSGLHRYFIIIE